MRLLTETEAIKFLEWPENFHAGRYLAHPGWPIRAILDWETSYVGDLESIARFAVGMFARSSRIIHWSTTRGNSSSSDFDRLVCAALFPAGSNDEPLIGMFEKEETDVLVGYLSYRMLTLADHTLLVPGEDCALGFTNDGECILYAAASGAVLWMQEAFMAFGEEIKEVGSTTENPNR